MITFEPFRIWYIKQKKKKTEMYKECGFAPGTVAKIWGDRMPFRSDVLDTICRVYSLKVEDVIEYREDEK